MNDLVTVILPTHKDPGTLHFAIRSVIRQSYPNFELLVVGDGADEDTLRTATLWREQDSRVRVLDLPKGPRRGWNNRVTALKESTGKYIFYLDEDDLWFENHLTDLVQIIEEEKSDFAASPVLTISPDDSAEISVADHSKGPLRFASPSYLNLYDTFICHSRSSYFHIAQDSEGPLAQGPHGLIRSYMSSGSSWSQLPSVTAMSMLGTPRVRLGISNSDRTAQIQNLLSGMESGILTPKIVQDSASVVSHLWGLFHHFPPMARSTSLSGYLVSISGVRNEKELKTWNSLTDRQRHLGKVTLRFFQAINEGDFPNIQSPWITEFEFSEIVQSLQRLVTGPPAMDSSLAQKWLTLFKTG